MAYGEMGNSDIQKYSSVFHLLAGKKMAVWLTFSVRSGLLKHFYTLSLTEIQAC